MQTGIPRHTKRLHDQSALPDSLYHSATIQKRETDSFPEYESRENYSVPFSLFSPIVVDRQYRADAWSATARTRYTLITQAGGRAPLPLLVGW